jgi:hypothetical protein
MSAVSTSDSDDGGERRSRRLQRPGRRSPHGGARPPARKPPRHCPRSTLHRRRVARCEQRSARGMTAMIAADIVHGWGGAAAAALLSDTEADAVTQRLVDSVLAPVVAFLLANDHRPEVVARVRDVVPLRRPHMPGRPGQPEGIVSTSSRLVRTDVTRNDSGCIRTLPRPMESNGREKTVPSTRRTRSPRRSCSICHGRRWERRNDGEDDGRQCLL